jgi:hypothetical protein
MNLKDIIAISGEGGLFRFLAQGRNAIIVEHLETGKRQTASAAARVSSLEDIAIFTTDEDLKLSVVFDRIWEKENGGQAIDSKMPPAALTKYFEGVIPEYDQNRVYISDIKKVIVWYNLLQKLNLLVKEEKTAEEEKTETEGGGEAAPAKAATVKTTAAKSGHTKAAPVKKAPPKSTTTKGRTKK